MRFADGKLRFCIRWELAIAIFLPQSMVLVVCHHRTGILITAVCPLIRFVFTRFEAVTHWSEVVPREQVHG
jgi:hypothetical protein